VDGAKIFEPMPGRPMREYVAVPPQVMADKKKLATWVSRALDYGRSLKPKSRASNPKKAGTKAKRPVSTKKKNWAAPAGLLPAKQHVPRMGGVAKNMPDIKHSVSIGAEPHVVYPLVASGEGLAKWWASDVTEEKPGGNADLGFFKRATVYGLKPIQLVAPRQEHWLCHTEKEWSGARFLFDFASDAKNILLRFTHADCQAETDYFVSYTTAWGELMFRIKARAEGHTRGALFLANSQAY
jgi:hypothetical protein